MSGLGPQPGLDEPALVGRVGREAALLMSAITSKAKPKIQMSKPITANASSPLRTVVVMATSAAATVNVTHSAWMVHTFRKRMKDGLSSSKRSSLPALRMRPKRNVPRRTAQITTSAHSRTTLASSCRSTAGRW